MTRILLDQGIFDMRNLGQNALLQAAVERIKKIWPDASIGVTTVAPQILNMFFPDVIPVSPNGKHAWYITRSRYDRIRRYIPRSVLRLILEVREEFWHRWPGFHFGSITSKIKSLFHSTASKNASLPPVEAPSIAQPDYASVVSGADIFIATGSQYMCDHARGTALQVLDRLDASIRCGIPTAMVGQGMGPIEDAELITRAKEILPLVDLFLVRERLEAPALLASLGVDPAKVFVTGDDAVELAYNARASALGRGIGISMRCMPSTKITDGDIPLINKALVQAAQKHNAELVGLPISLSIHERDDLCTKQLMNGYRRTWMSRKNFQTPLEFIKNIQRCRLVIAGTFHGALLSLAQGVPVICVVRSELYANKFYGMADLFSPGCEILFLDDKQFSQKFISSVDSTWQAAEELRKNLLDKAAQQIEWGNLAYQRLLGLVDIKKNQ